MARLTQDEYYLEMLALVAERSTCERRWVGAIIVDYKGKVLSTGYNGVPSGFPHCIDTKCAGASDPPGDTRRCLAVHAEQNAIMQCSDLRLAHTLYVTCSPCFTCAKMIANTSIKRVVCLEPYAEQSPVLTTAGIEIVVANCRDTQ